jgi:hypothetical protein
MPEIGAHMGITDKKEDIKAQSRPPEARKKAWNFELPPLPSEPMPLRRQAQSADAAQAAAQAPPEAAPGQETGAKAQDVEIPSIDEEPDFADAILQIKKGLGLGEKTEAPEETPGILSKLDDFDKENMALQRRMVELQWKAAHGGNCDEEIASLGQENAELVERTGYVELVRNGLLSQPADNDTRRELELRYKQLQVSHVMSHPQVLENLQFAQMAQREFAVIIDQVPFTVNDVEQMLSAMDDPMMRLKASMAKDQSQVLCLPKLMLFRNLSEATRALEGRESFAHLLFETQDSTADGFSELIMSFEERTRASMRKLDAAVCKTFGLDAIPHRDANYYYSRFFNSIDTKALPKDASYALERVRMTLSAMGFGKVHGARFLNVDAIGMKPFTFSISGGEGVSQGQDEFAMRVAPGAFDYRVFVNPEMSASGLEYVRTVLLESARAVHFYALDRLEARDAFKWDSDCMRNAMSMLISSVVSEEKWLQDIAGLPPNEARILSRMMELNNLQMARRMASEALFEMSLFYGEEPMGAYRRIQEGFHGRGIDYEVERHWAWHPYLAKKPGAQIGYMQGYLIYELIRKDMLQKYGTLLHPEAAEHIIDNYFTGHRIPWPQRLKDLVERDLARDSGKVA